jgi:ankyrin repeat protein
MTPDTSVPHPLSPPSAHAPRALPAHPDPEQLRRQAKELLAAWRRGDADALARAAPYRLAPPPRLAQAQLVLARELGCASWTALMAEVRRRREAALNDADFLDRLLTLALGRGYEAPKPAQAWALLRQRQGQGPLPLVAKLVAGDGAGAQQALAVMGPNAVHARLGPWQLTPLLCVAFSSLARLSPPDAPGSLQQGLVDTLDGLLQQGADPNASLVDPSYPDHPQPALFGAVARAACLPMVQRLLAAGANPNDNESLYHATEQSDRRIIAALVQAGARWQGTNALYRQLDHDNLAHLAQVLDLGADVRERGPGGGGPLHHALIRGRGLPFIELPVARGADPGLRDAHGFTPAALAARSGDVHTLAFLAGLGHHPPDSLRDRLLAACAAADEASARALLAQLPGGVASLDPLALRLLPDQAQRGHQASVQLMLQLGWPVAVPGDWQASALNQAAFRGDAAMVQLLLAHGARWDERNGYGGTALGSCTHAGLNEPVAGGDYLLVLQLLLQDGAPVPASANDWPEDWRAVAAAKPGVIPQRHRQA